MANFSSLVLSTRVFMNLSFDWENCSGDSKPVKEGSVLMVGTKTQKSIQPFSHINI